MYRFFIKPENINENVVKITGSDFNHISHSLRLETGDEITVSTGDGWDNLVILEHFTDELVSGRIKERKLNQNEPKLKVTLGQAIPKKNNMDLIVQKTTEIGINKIIPLETKRTIVKLQGKKRAKRRERWQRIAEEAAKQSQRGKIPDITEIMSLKKIEQIVSEYDLILIPWENEIANDFNNIWYNIKETSLENILIIIGPEGGFTEEEVDFILSLGGQAITLGPRILRTETAGLVTLTMLLYEAGDLGGN